VIKNKSAKKNKAGAEKTKGKRVKETIKNA
jgi:hypothetical protein